MLLMHRLNIVQPSVKSRLSETDESSGQDALLGMSVWIFSSVQDLEFEKWG